MRHGICLSRLPRIHLSLRKVVMFLDIYFLILVRFMLDLVIFVFGVICIFLLTMKLIRFLVAHAMLNLSLHHPRTILMLP